MRVLVEHCESSELLAWFITYLGESREEVQIDLQVKQEEAHPE
jgi:hypothetical protein